MTPVTPVSSVSSSGASTAANLEAIALLQAQMLRYALTAIAEKGPPNADYLALQAAIKSGNVSEAQTALSRLQRDSQAASSSATAPASTTATLVDGGTGTVEPATGHSLDTTA
jgi:hypothetical protein